jgi:hypothetical protein
LIYLLGVTTRACSIGSLNKTKHKTTTQKQKTPQKKKKRLLMFHLLAIEVVFVGGEMLRVRIQVFSQDGNL